MSTLFVGGGFFVGYEIMGRLLRDGHDLTVVALHPPADEFRERVEWLQVDRDDGPELRRRLAGRKFDLVFDNVAYNAAQVDKLVQAVDGRTDRFFLTSTIDTYPNATPKVFAEHEEKANPSDRDGRISDDTYSRGKRGCERALTASGLPWTVIRPAIVTGRRDNMSCPPLRTVAPGEPSRSLFFPFRIVHGGPILLRQDDECVFCLLWVADLASAVCLLLQTKSSIGQAYNVAGEEVWTSERLIMTLARSAGRAPDFVRVSPMLLAQAGLANYQPPYGHAPLWQAVENEKLRRLGWRPSSPDIWAADLIEAVPSRFATGWYDRRHREIALAHHVVRQRANLLPLESMSSPGSPGVFSRTRGRFRPEAASRWMTQVSRAEFEQAGNEFQKFRGGRLSRFGLGTWKGDNSDATDMKYVDAIVHAVKSGINVIDTAVNYRAMHAERCVGRALKQLRKEGFDRSAVLVCTKGGFIPHDGANSSPYDDYARRRYLQKELVSSAELTRRHSIRPEFIRYSLEQSLNNLCVVHVDLYYLHNPENALNVLDRDAFYAMLTRTFEVLEEAAAGGRIGGYGLATWYGLMVEPSDKRHLSLARAVEIARSVAGANHHLQAVQMPYSALRPTARTSASQEVDGKLMPPLEAAGRLGLYCVTNATVGQGQPLGRELVQRLKATGPELPPHRAMLRVARSTPGVGTSLIGMRERKHVDEAIEVAKMPALEAQELERLLDAVKPFSLSDWPSGEGAVHTGPPPLRRTRQMRRPA